MGKSGPGYKQASLIIEHKSAVWKLIGTFILTTVLWLYGVLMFLMLSSAVLHVRWTTLNQIKAMLQISDHSLRLFMYAAVIVWSIFLFLMCFWRDYNKSRFGWRNRRTYPTPVTDEEIRALDLISEEDYQRLKSAQVVRFDTNPIRPLNEGRG